MSEVKPYKKQEVPKQSAAEPIVEYSTVMEDVGYLSDDILIDAIKYTQMACEKGRMIPNKKVYELLAERMGWK